MTSLDGINGRSIQTLLRGENDSKQSDEFQAKKARKLRKTKKTLHDLTSLFEHRRGSGNARKFPRSLESLPRVSSDCARFVGNKKMLKTGGGGKRRDLGPRNDVLTTCKAITLRDGQRIIAAFFPQ